MKDPDVGASLDTQEGGLEAEAHTSAHFTDALGKCVHSDWTTTFSTK